MVGLGSRQDFPEYGSPVQRKSGENPVYTGHLAETIIQYLRKTECEIHGLILPSENGESDSQITYYKGDITKPESLEEIFSGLSGADPVKRLVYVSSVHAIPETEEKTTISEAAA